MISFTQIPDKLKYPLSVKGTLSAIHSQIISHVINTYSGTFKERRNAVQLLNSVSYAVLMHDSLPTDWSDPKCLEEIRLIDEDICKPVLGDIYLTERKIQWDVALADNLKPVSEVRVQIPEIQNVVLNSEEPTSKEDLYIRAPQVPRFDATKSWMSGMIDETLYVIHPSLPIIPKRQNEISATTDVSLLTSSDMRKLYPNRFVPTRSPIMYEFHAGLTFHSKLGVVFPINGYSEAQIIDNIVKYPHLFRLTKLIDDKIVSFYTTIEINGELYKLSEIWKSLPESEVIPYNTDFIKEYVVRRYLLERDIDNIDHKYKMFGTLDPYLTLFMPMSDYIELGYSDIDEIAKQCVMSRVSYKQSRNPIIRRLANV